MNYKAEEQLQPIKGAVKFTFTDVRTGEQEIIHVLNVFCNSGKESIAERIARQTTTKGRITYFATGTGAGTPAASDTTLFTELFRKPISVVDVNSNVAHFTTYLSTSESNGTLTEVGLFGDNASATANSGVLYAHTDITKTKTTNDTLTVEWAITIN